VLCSWKVSRGSSRPLFSLGLSPPRIRAHAPPGWHCRFILSCVTQELFLSCWRVRGLPFRRQSFSFCRGSPCLPLQHLAPRDFLFKQTPFPFYGFVYRSSLSRAAQSPTRTPQSPSPKIQIPPFVFKQSFSRQARRFSIRKSFRNPLPPLFFSKS